MKSLEKKRIFCSDSSYYSVSNATLKNWNKLNNDFAGRLTMRANKRMSEKRFLPLEYVSNNNSIAFIKNILDYIETNELDIASVVLSIGVGLLKKAGIYEKQHVISVLNNYSNLVLLEELEKLNLPQNEFDFLGLLYQSYLREGEKNCAGSYYTPAKVAHNMTKNFCFSENELFLDPCCGSGAFLLSVTAQNPNQIYGIDRDEIAVLISKINLLLKYRDFVFTPQVYCLNFLAGFSIIQQHTIFEKKFDYIATNPPWGAMNNECFCSDIFSKETFSYFFVKAFEQLKEFGTIRFLFPEAILNVKIHKDIRKFMLEKARLVSITIYNDMFSGVTTKYVDIECGNSSNKEKFCVYTGAAKRIIDVKTIYETDNLIFNLLSDIDMSVVQIAKDRKRFSLRNSVWALGIVTGDNKKKLSLECLPQMEKIYTGKEIKPYVLHPAQNYILYDRNNLQQVAKEKIYRAPEKLVYKFISNKLVFAYDNSASLFLNSANILIPKIPSMSIKTVMAFLNSTLFQFLYIKLFGEIKILKGNLMELPFPEITSEENNTIVTLVDKVLNGNNFTQEIIDNYIFSIYNLTNEQIKYVREIVNGKIDKGIKKTNSDNE